MYNIGDIVVKTENDKNLFYVVLFNYYFNDLEYVCTCKINRRYFKYRIPKNYIHIPYLILSNKNLCNIKLDASFIFSSKEVSNTLLKLESSVMLKVYEKLLNLDNKYTNLEKEHYEFIRNNINVLKHEILETEKKLNKEKKKEIKQLRKERKRNYKKHQ